MVDISERVGPWIFGRLSGDATLAGLVSTRIYRGVAPQGAAYPLITFSPQSGLPFAGVAGSILAQSDLWQVKVIGSGDSPASIRPISDRVIQLLHKAPPSVVNGVQIAECTFQQNIPQPDEYVGSVRYFYSNSQFRVQAYPR